MVVRNEMPGEEKTTWKAVFIPSDVQEISVRLDVWDCACSLRSFAACRSVL